MAVKVVIDLRDKRFSEHCIMIPLEQDASYIYGQLDWIGLSWSHSPFLLIWSIARLLLVISRLNQARLFEV